MEERYQVSTPENISFNFDVAGIGSRFMAALVDVAIYGVISIAAGLITLQIINRLDDDHLISVIVAVYTGLDFVLYWGYYILFEIIWGGQSPGKRLLKLRVVRLDGTPADAGQIVMRNIGRLVDIFPGFYAVGVITMFLNDQSRRLGDLAAGTLVVRESQPLTLDQLSASTSTIPLSDKARAEAAMLPLYRLSRNQIDIAREFIQRRANMKEPQRARLAMQIGLAVATQMGVALPSYPAQAEYLLELVIGRHDQ
jgi:uncharacterized RDD family membrane protein YckC